MNSKTESVKNFSTRKNAIRFLPLGGLGEIGMNCLVLETKEELFLIDCGLQFSDLSHYGIDFYIPDFTYVVERKDKFKGFIITHAHEDHIGSIAFALKAGLEAPIYASKFTAAMIQRRLVEYELEDSVRFKIYKANDSVVFDSIQFEFIPVNHSIVESFALYIKTDAGTIFHTADFRIDDEPFIGKKMDLDYLKKLGDQGVDLLLADSTNILRKSQNLSEGQVFKNLSKWIENFNNRIIVTLFASNVARVEQLAQIAKNTKRSLFLSGRSLEQTVHIAQLCGYLKGIEEVLVSLDQLDETPREKVLVIASGCQADFRSAMMRIARGEHSQVKIEEGDRILFSARSIPGNEKGIHRMMNELCKQGAEIIDARDCDIHASGHATYFELKKIHELLRPQYFLPVHGEYRFLVEHKKLAESLGLKKENICVGENGSVFEFTPDYFRQIDKIELGRTLIEGSNGHDVSSVTLKERRNLGEKGIALVMILVNEKTEDLLLEPEIILRGLLHNERQEKLRLEAISYTKKTIERFKKLDLKERNDLDLQEKIRIELRRFFEQKLNKKPPVICLVLKL